MRLTPLALAVAFAPPLAAQGTAQPPPELQKYASLVGTWHGTGTALQGAGAASKWTSYESYRWVLGGQFLRQDSRIELEGQDVPLQFTSFYGFDRERQRWVVLAMSNGGTIDLAEVFWDADGAMITAHVKPLGAVVQVDRWVTTVKRDMLTTVGWQASGAGAFAEYVKGTAKRTDKKPVDVRLLDTSFATAEVADKKSRMQRIVGMRGIYGFAGSMSRTPGRDMVACSGTVSAAPIFDGTVLQIETSYDVTPEMPAPAYESLAWIAWDAHDRCYETAWITSTGECGVADTSLLGDRVLVTMRAGRRHEQPIAARHVIELDEGGRMARTYADAMLADAPPARVVEATYTAK
jgi:hypothetical protein